MSIIVRVLGAFMFSVIMYAPPILTTCSYVFGWDAALPLTLLTVSQFGYVWYYIIEKAGE